MKSSAVSKPPSIFKKVLSGIKEVGPLFGSVNGAIVAVGGVIPIWVTPSPSLRATMTCGAIVGGAVGYFVTPYPWSRKNKDPLNYAIGFGIGLLVALTLLMVTNPANEWAGAIHDFFMTNIATLYALMLVTVTAMFFCATSFICVIAKKAKMAK